MLTNSDTFLCSEYRGAIGPEGDKIGLGVIPRNLHRTSPSSFMYCDYTGSHTQIMEIDVHEGTKKVIESIEGAYSSWDFHDDLGLLLNRQGDLVLYNLLDRTIYEAEKQHPGVYIDADIMHSGEYFITSGGSVKNPFSGFNERIIKVWQIEKQDDIRLSQASRINTGHTSHIEHSSLINNSKVLTVSADSTLRLTNLLKEEVEAVIKIKDESQLLSTCQLDANTILAGGISNRMKVIDLRCRRLLNIPIKINSEFVQICCLQRFTDSLVLVANLNEIHGLDLRKWSLHQLAHYDGWERISQLLALNNKDFIVANRDRTMQLWKAS